MTSYRCSADSSRNGSIDIFRGSLALLVILGHCAELTDRDNFLTWFGFGFRMPLFIGLSGFLFNLERAREISFGALIGKYYRRLLLPWGVACLFHLVATQSIDWVAPLYILIRPPYHLWFVPVMMTFIFLAKLSRMNATTMLGVTIPISIIAMYFFGVGHDIEQYHPWMPDRRYFIFPFYFTFGLWVARQPYRSNNRLLLLLTALGGLIWWSWLYDHADAQAEVAAKLVMCTPCIALFPLLKRLDLHVATLEQVGRNSLFLYLWHPFIFGLWRAAGVEGVSMLSLSLLSLLMIWLIAIRIPPLCQILGISRPEREGMIMVGTNERTASQTPI